ncbi:ABC transporter permease [Pelagibius sp.]|uniref:ABC transporter permease n=1 Tax=Pelagibius sp. TaxID=1931238 RepID=UPI003BAF562A
MAMPPLARMILRRVVVGVPAILGVLVVTFLLVRLSGESPATYLAGPHATQAEVQEVSEKLGLGRSIGEQLWIYLGDVARGDLGESWLSDRPVLDELAERLPVTLELVLLAMLLGGISGVLLGLKAAFSAGGRLDRIINIVAITTFSVPVYVVGLLAILVVFYWLGWAPAPMGRLSLSVFPPPVVTGSYFIDGLLAGDLEVVRSAGYQLWLPTLCFSLIVAGPTVKQTRAILLEVLGSDYVRYARACGLPRRDINRIAIRNSLVPVATFLAFELSYLFAASSLIELIFAWGGIGQYGLTAILQGDFTAVQGYVLFLAAFSLLVYFLADLFVFVVEPRSRS